ncbi:UNVERIFIED_CONTAM: hypothetical protein Sindi_0157800 [Sesamum indicum]
MRRHYIQQKTTPAMKIYLAQMLMKEKYANQKRNLGVKNEARESVCDWKWKVGRRIWDGVNIITCYYRVPIMLSGRRAPRGEILGVHEKEKALGGSGSVMCLGHGGGVWGP